MARIRTIKPEFQQSASMGKVSRDARLTFILLWPQADDSGRLRGSSRMLASILFPVDDDAPSLIDGWLGELESAGSIQRYQVDGDHYIQICKWLDHQKIDHPGKSKLPCPRESSRRLAKKSESSRKIPLDQGSRIKEGIKDQGDAEVFERVKAAYPKRAGGNPWNKAEKAIAARLREGSKAVEILDGLDRYAAFIRATGKEGTEYVMQAATFCGPDKRFLESWDLPPTKAQAAQDQNIRAGQDWLERTA